MPNNALDKWLVRTWKANMLAIPVSVSLEKEPLEIKFSINTFRFFCLFLLYLPRFAACSIMLIVIDLNPESVYLQERKKKKASLGKMFKKPRKGGILLISLCCFGFVYPSSKSLKQTE